MTYQPLLIDGEWLLDTGSDEAIRAIDPAANRELPDAYPIAPWTHIDRALSVATAAQRTLVTMPDAAMALADFLDYMALEIEARAEALVDMAHLETALPAEPRLRTIELPRTTDQLRQAAAAARSGSWRMPTIDTRANIRSQFEPLAGPVVVFGPNNFPLAFNAVGGGDFAAAIATGHPVLAKANPGHPGTTRLLAEAAVTALRRGPLPLGLVQLIYHVTPEDGLRLVADARLGATAFTGSRTAGLKLKAAADLAGKPIYLEMASVNPVVVLPGALSERLEAIATEFTASSLLGAGQFCTNPGLVLLVDSPQAEAFVQMVKKDFETVAPGTLLSQRVPFELSQTVDKLRQHGAALVTGGHPPPGTACAFAHTLLRVTGTNFLRHAQALQTEAFGPAALFVFTTDSDQLVEVAENLEGGLTASVYSHSGYEDEHLYRRLAPILRRQVGRLLNDKMPTGVAVSPAMVHGGAYPATGHPGFTAVGIPASLRRFAALHCYDAVRAHRLPPELRDQNPTGKLWRQIDGVWTQGDVVRA